MTPKLSPESQKKVDLALEICAESSKRMNTYSDEQRAELEKKGREIIEKGKK